LTGPLEISPGIEAIALLPHGSVDGWGVSNCFEQVRANLIFSLTNPSISYAHVAYQGYRTRPFDGPVIRMQRIGTALPDGVISIATTCGTAKELSAHERLFGKKTLRTMRRFGPCGFANDYMTVAVFLSGPLDESERDALAALALSGCSLEEPQQFCLTWSDGRFVLVSGAI
jgi:hypothetical protein